MYTRMYRDAAKNLGLRYEIMDDRIITIYKGRKQISFDFALYGNDPAVVYKITRDKHLTHLALAPAGVPKFEQKKFRRGELTKALAYARKKKFNIVVKPTTALEGRGITVLPKNKEIFAKAFKRALKNGPAVIVEKYYDGEDYRFLICKGKLLAVTHREPPFVIGDGAANMSTLIRRINRHRKTVEHLSEIKIKPRMKEYLKKQGMSMKTIPEEGEKVFISQVANAHNGGLYSNIPLSKIHPDNKKAALKAVKATDMSLCGLDFMSKDITVSYKKNKAAVTELNPFPAIELQMWAAENPVPDTPEQIIKLLLK
jgi:cyanophycin synthetase